MRVISKALVFFWVTTILVASTCFGADLHYCEGEVQTFSVYDVAKPCNMHKKKSTQAEEKKLPPCCQARKIAQEKALEGKPVFKKGKCCYNDQVVFKTDSEQQTSSIDLQKVDLEKVLAFNGEYLASSWNNFAISNPPFRGPPDVILRHNYQIFFQVFRI
ncbi:hypothetical protein N9355_08985 [Crocinitomicaceae bacterium]|nr:hypothetical protein [Crocinitomicaceae bacterium]